VQWTRKGFHHGGWLRASRNQTGDIKGKSVLAGAKVDGDAGTTDRVVDAQVLGLVVADEDTAWLVNMGRGVAFAAPVLIGGAGGVGGHRSLYGEYACRLDGEKEEQSGFEDRGH